MSHARIEEMLAESGLDAEEMSDVVLALGPLAGPADEVPTPAAELERLFGPTRGRTLSQLFGPRRSAVAGVLVLALSGVGATGLSAAANTLPRPLQHEVSKFSRHFLPFDLPEPPAPAQPELPLGAVLPQPGDTRMDDGPTASRSAQPRHGDASDGLVVHLVGIPTAQAEPSHSATESAAPTSTASAEPQTSYAPRPTSSPSPSDDSPTPGKDQPGKGAPTPRDDGKKPGKGHGQPGEGKGGGGQDGGQNGGTDPGQGQANPGDPAQGGQPSPDPGQDPGPGDGGTTPAPTLPDVPVPSLPLPDPVPGLGAIVDGVTDPGN